MTAEFHASRDFQSEACSELASLDPLNPFRTTAYASAMNSLGKEPWLFYSKENGRVIHGCWGFLETGRLSRTLDIPSAPNLTRLDPFWIHLSDFCRQHRVSHLSIQTFASTKAEIPTMEGEIERRSRVEHYLDLRNPDMWSMLSTNHLRNLRKAKKACVELERSTTSEACQDHVRLQNASMERRSSRGEQVSADAQVRTTVALIEHRAGELFRAKCEGVVLSSILILRSSKGAYYHTAGTSPEGMAVGASHFLIWQIAEALRADGIEQFNLGGADSNNPGLERFKKGFGPREERLETASFYLASPLRRSITAAIRALKNDPFTLIRDLAGRVEKYCVYCCDPRDFGQSVTPQGVEFRKLTDEELLRAASRHSEMEMYKHKYEELKVNDAYGVFVDQNLAHVSWFVPADHDRLSKERNVWLTAGEAEITHAVTLKEYRGRGFYAFAIRCLIDIGLKLGVQRIYMITGTDNAASQKGIEKAGLKPAGRLWRIRYRHFGGRSIVIRGHRLHRFFFFLPFFRDPEPQIRAKAKVPKATSGRN